MRLKKKEINLNNLWIVSSFHSTKKPHCFFFKIFREPFFTLTLIKNLLIHLNPLYTGLNQHTYEAGANRTKNKIENPNVMAPPLVAISTTSAASMLNASVKV